MIFVTGGNGFIGSNYVLNWLAEHNEPIVVLDLLTYAANQELLNGIHTKDYHFVHGCITNKPLVASILQEYQPRAIINFAAETHVDKSILNPETFINTNLYGSFTLLEAARDYWFKLNAPAKETFRFIQISTDEVYGSLEPSDLPFTEKSAFKPSNPYSASKAAADHLVQAYNATYQLPTIITHCSNNFGPYQFPEKLIPLTIMNALEHKPIGLYGSGLNIRDWIYVEDHCHAINTVLNQGKIGETYNIGSYQEKTNISVVEEICSILDILHPHAANIPYSSFITYIKDRPGHDYRYAIDHTKIKTHLNWQPKHTFHTGLKKTIQWYLNNLQWVYKIKNSTHFQEWIKLNYSIRKMA